jgi:hypothetical protein
MQSNIIVPPLSGVRLNITGTFIFAGVGDPNAASTDNSDSQLAGASIGSIFLRTDAPDSTHAFYVKSAASTWTAK